MQKADRSKFGIALRAKQAELLSSLRLVTTLRRGEGLSADSGGDELDEVQRDMERDLAVRSLDRDTALLRDVRAAVARIESNTYGHCLGCDEEIGQKRLQAVPWAAYCVACQDARDRGDDFSEEEANGNGRRRRVPEVARDTVEMTRSPHATDSQPSPGPTRFPDRATRRSPVHEVVRVPATGKRGSSRTALSRA